MPPLCTLACFIGLFHCADVCVFETGGLHDVTRQPLFTLRPLQHDYIIFVISFANSRYVLLATLGVDNLGVFY
jgi:hypothetical protein